MLPCPVIRQLNPLYLPTMTVCAVHTLFPKLNLNSIPTY